VPDQRHDMQAQPVSSSCHEARFSPLPLLEPLLDVGPHRERAARTRGGRCSELPTTLAPRRLHELAEMPETPPASASLPRRRAPSHGSATGRTDPCIGPRASGLATKTPICPSDRRRYLCKQRDKSLPTPSQPRVSRVLRPLRPRPGSGRFGARSDCATEKKCGAKGPSVYRSRPFAPISGRRTGRTAPATRAGHGVVTSAPNGRHVRATGLPSPLLSGAVSGGMSAGVSGVDVSPASSRSRLACCPIEEPLLSVRAPAAPRTEALEGRNHMPNEKKGQGNAQATPQSRPPRHRAARAAITPSPPPNEPPTPPRRATLRDPRLPPPGTVLTKRGPPRRHPTANAPSSPTASSTTATLYRSLSAAAMSVWARKAPENEARSGAFCRAGALIAAAGGSG